MIDRISVRNFQSLRSVDLELGALTVVVGPSSSGKSALVRALRTLVSNSRGAGYVTRGQKVATITAAGERSGRAWQATIERGEGHGLYQLVDGDRELTFTKLGGAVPEEVTAALAIAPSDTLHFAGQFDRPYLLDDTGSEVARVLGKLTNVTVVLEAAREANRRHRETVSQLRTRQSDLESLSSQAQGYVGLAAKLEAQSSAEQALERHEGAVQRVERLRLLLDTLRVAEHFLSTLEVVEPPGLGALNTARDRHSRFQSLVREWAGGSRVQSEAGAEAARLESEIDVLDSEHHQVLHDAGTCPMCGQSTRELASV